MYCRTCGHMLEDGDAFCTNCGTSVPKEELSSRASNGAPKSEEFRWNVKDEFPEPRKRETMVFNWADGTMRPASSDASDAPISEPAAPQPRATYEPTAPQPQVAHEPIPVAQTEPLEALIARDAERASETASANRDDRFYTFTQKNEEFQRLLDAEYDRIHRNGVPVERPLRAGSSLFTEPAYEPAPPYEPTTPLSPIREAAKPVYEPAPAYKPEAPKYEPAPKEAYRPVTPAPTYKPETPTYKPSAPMARPEPTFQGNPEEIRTIWEEIKADMDRENRARIAEAAEKEREAKLASSVAKADTARAAEPAPKEATPLSVNRKALLTLEETKPLPEKPPVRMADRKTEEVAAVTATALTRIWEDGDEEDEEDEAPRKKGHFWLVFFLILLILLLSILAVFAVQTIWPDTPAAEFAASVEVHLKDFWSKVTGLFQ